MSNPELFRQMMESPMMQNLMSNPEALQTLLTSNPQIQQLMEVLGLSLCWNFSTTQNILIL